MAATADAQRAVVAVAITGPSGAPVPDVEAVVLGAAGRARSGGDGVARVSVPAGSGVLRLRSPGFPSAFVRYALRPGDTALVALSLPGNAAPVPVASDPADASPEQRRASGRYSTQPIVGASALARRPASSLANALRGADGVRFVDERNGGPDVAFAVAGGGWCRPALVLDDVILDAARAESAGAASPASNWLSALTAGMVSAVELWLASRPTPAHLRDVAAGCGAIVATSRGDTPDGLRVVEEGQGQGAIALTAVVVDGAGGTVADAQVSVVGSSIRGTTNSRGVVVLRDVPEGPRLIRVQKVGHLPVTSPVTVSRGDTVTNVFELPRLSGAQPLDTVNIAGRRGLVPLADVPVMLRGFEERRRSQRYPSATYISRDDNTRRSEQAVSDWLRASSRIRVQSGSRRYVELRGGSGRSRWCLPQVFLDGNILSTNGVVDDVSPTTVAAVEVHSVTAGAPSEFIRPGNSCGVVLIWSLT